MKPRLVEGWRAAWRWWSMQLHVVGTLLASALLLVPTMPQEVQDLIPPGWRAVAIGLWFAAGVLARITEQKPKSKICDGGGEP
jgi:hypothetical protein